MSSEQSNPPTETGVTAPAAKASLLPWLAWGVAGIMLALMVVVILSRFIFPQPTTETTEEQPISSASQPLPAYQPSVGVHEINRITRLNTIIPDRPNDEVITYTVEPGDSIFSIATSYDLKPESVLWANQATLQDDPQLIEVGLSLYIPPVDGVYYQWQEGDTIDSVAARYYVDPEDIINWPANNIDLANPVINPGQYVMIPDGTGQFRQWVIPTVFRPRSGATSGVGSQCTIPDGAYWGTGSFIWPTANHSISGNDFWDGHLGIDIAAYVGDPVWASDSGVVVYAGAMSGGYGNVVMIEHDTSYHIYHSVYAHLNSISVQCGQTVVQGQVIGGAGSTGNSTGPHLHFEIRQDGGFINPHYVLP